MIQKRGRKNAFTKIIAKALLVTAIPLLISVMVGCFNIANVPNEVPTYMVTYNGNGNTGGSVPVDSNNYEEGQTVTVLDNTGNLTKTNYIFTGWNTQADGNGTNYAPAEIFTMGTEDVTLYAKWSGAGYQETYTADGVSFKMSFVPGGYTFPTESDDSGTATVNKPYRIGETEVTYELWYKVYTWATSNGYTFANTGIPGNDGTAGTETTSQEPVTTVNWRDAMVWCNALTEWYNAKTGTSYTCVYKDGEIPIRDSRDDNAIQCDSVTPDGTANGFRLLTSNEWELAARWRDDNTNTVSGYIDPYFTKGNSASGATTFYNDNNGGGEPAKSANDLVAVYGYYWDNSWVSTGVTGTAEVKSKGVSGANSLGLYDMSGNVWEWCFDFDLSGTNRVGRGGSWTHDAGDLRVGEVNGASPDSMYEYLGFRFSRTK